MFLADSINAATGLKSDWSANEVRVSSAALARSGTLLSFP
jgi:hypothetical protein